LDQLLLLLLKVAAADPEANVAVAIIMFVLVLNVAVVDANAAVVFGCFSFFGSCFKRLNVLETMCLLRDSARMFWKHVVVFVCGYVEFSGNMWIVLHVRCLLALHAAHRIPYLLQ
jgi:hypothetical protein